MTYKVYDLFLHWKQGDDLNRFIETADSPQQALLDWATFMEKNAEKLKKLSTLFKDKELNISSDTHSIILSGDVDALEAATHENLISFEEIEGDEINYEYPTDNDKLERTCFRCNRPLYFSEFYDINSHQFSEEQASILWQSKALKFLCCTCITNLKCKSCGQELKPFLIDDKDYLFYCSKCFRIKSQKLIFLLKEKDEIKSLKLILEIANGIIEFKPFIK